MSVSRLLLPLAFACFFAAADAQVDSVYSGRVDTVKSRRDEGKSRHPLLDKLQWGGNFQAWIGNPTFILLSPTIGFPLHKDLSAGIGVIYNYTSYNTVFGRYSQSIYGGHSYLRQVIRQNYFVQLQFDRLYQPNLLGIDPSSRIWVNYLMAGGGLRHRIGTNAVFMTSIMYNFTPHLLSIYPTRLVVQFGIAGGF